MECRALVERWQAEWKGPGRLLLMPICLLCCLRGCTMYSPLLPTSVRILYSRCSRGTLCVSSAFSRCTWRAPSGACARMALATTGTAMVNPLPSVARIAVGPQGMSSRRHQQVALKLPNPSNAHVVKQPTAHQDGHEGKHPLVMAAGVVEKGHEKQEAAKPW